MRVNYSKSISAEIQIHYLSQSCTENLREENKIEIN